MSSCLRGLIAFEQVLILLCQVLLSSIQSPSTTNVIKEPFVVAELHTDDDAAPGRHNFCSKFIGERHGMRLDAFMTKNIRWFLVGLIVSIVLVEIANGALSTTWRSAALLVSAFAQFAVILPFAFCCRASVFGK